jgi:Kyakuja-Dileera-Zisupton transposase
MNVDYAICNALKYGSAGLPQALIIYDIGCQWIINFKSRLRDSHHLSIPDAMELLVAVGKFHLSAHVKECFALYSLNFVHGSGQLDGEILETLWAPFNFISASARTMSMASRHQVYDDHMRDSNWKKIVGMGRCHNILNGHRKFTFCHSFSFYSSSKVRESEEGLE